MTAPPIAFTGAIEDRLRIRERYDCYSDAVSRADLPLYLACWSNAAVRTGAGGECAGKTGLREHWERTWQLIDRMTFFTQIAAIDVRGARATARAFTLEILSLRNGETTQVVGQYDDQLERVGMDWLFAARHYQVVMTALDQAG